MISIATHDTWSESDGRSAFGSPGAVAEPASGSTEGGAHYVKCIPKPGGRSMCGPFLCGNEVGGAPSPATVRSRQATLRIGGYLEATSRGIAQRPKGRRRW